MQQDEILITGGAGFVGTNVALSYLQEGQSVHILDNLSRAGSDANIAELKRLFPRTLRFTRANVQDAGEMDRAVRSAGLVYHFAAQVAVTTSLENPISDLESNLLGTMRLLEAVRRRGSRCPLLFTSTNKVYGKLASVGLRRRGARWEPEDERLAAAGAGEDQPLEFLSPYGCSKGSADQYVLDYAHSFQIPATVFRMSCIYGPYQMGSEDQGWVAHFVRQAMKGLPVTIFGDGRQVRDLLFVGDLVQAMRTAQDNMQLASGEAFNIGGGTRNSTSLLELLRSIGDLIGREVDVEWGAERLADQRWYVADTAKIMARLGWSPSTSISEGLRALHDWYLGRPELVAPLSGTSHEHSAVQVA